MVRFAASSLPPCTIIAFSAYRARLEAKINIACHVGLYPRLPPCCLLGFVPALPFGTRAFRLAFVSVDCMANFT